MSKVMSRSFVGGGPAHRVDHHLIRARAADLHRAREGLEPQRAAGLEGERPVDPLLDALRPGRGAPGPGEQHRDDRAGKQSHGHLGAVDGTGWERVAGYMHHLPSGFGARARPVLGHHHLPRGAEVRRVDHRAPVLRLHGNLGRHAADGRHPAEHRGRVGLPLGVPVGRLDRGGDRRDELIPDCLHRGAMDVQRGHALAEGHQEEPHDLLDVVAGPVRASYPPSDPPVVSRRRRRPVTPRGV